MTGDWPTDDKDPATSDLAARLEQLETRVDELHQRVFALRLVVASLLALYVVIVVVVAFSPGR